MRKLPPRRCDLGDRARGRRAARHAGYAAGANIDQGGFDAKVAADGTVKLTDKPGVRVALAGKQIIEDYLASDKTLAAPAAIR